MISILNVATHIRHTLNNNVILRLTLLHYIVNQIFNEISILFFHSARDCAASRVIAGKC